MRSRHSSKKHLSSKHRPRRRKQFILENLDRRILLSAGSDLLPGVDPGAFIPDSFGIADVFYNNSAAWDAIEDDFPGQIDSVNDWVLSDTDGQSGSSDLSESLNDIFGGAAASGSVYQLYLDFNGGQVYSRSGDFYLGSSYVTIPAYNLGLYGWAGQEQQSIEYITNFVRDDYAAYNVSVTSAKPISGEYTTIYIGGTNDWFRPNSGVIGVATYDVGNHDASNFGFAFTDELSIYYSYSGGSLLNFSEYVANLISHEAAHTFGSDHVSDTTALMNPYLPLSPRTTCFGADSTQNTQTLLGTNLGYAHGSDDYGNSIQTARNVTYLDSINGLLERRDDVDTFSFTAPVSGTAVISINTSIYSNLDSRLHIIRNSDQVVIAANDDYNGQTDSQISFEVERETNYTIYVSSSDGMSSGSYQLMLDIPDSAPQLYLTGDVEGSDNYSLDFGSLLIDDSASASIIIGNRGSADLVISQIVVGAGFNIDIPGLGGAENLVIPAGGERSLVITFDPDQPGSYHTNLIIVSNDADQNTIEVSLTGNAEEPAPQISLVWAGSTINLDDAVLDFGDFTRGVITQQTLTIQNPGTDTLIINDINVTEPFSIADGFSGQPLIIAPGQSEVIILSVTGSSRQQLSGQMEIESNVSGTSTATFGLTSQIVGGALAVHESAQIVDDLQINFGTVYSGEQAYQSLTLVNTGDDTLTITDLIIAGGFTLPAGFSNNDITLPVGGSLVLNVGYSPQQADEATGTLTIITDDIEAPLTIVYLAAEGKTDPLEVREADGTEDGILNAGRRQIGSDHPIAAWIVTNHGNVPLTISLAISNDCGFSLDSPATIVIAAQQSRVVSVQLDTLLALRHEGQLALTANDIHQTTRSLDISADAYALINHKSPYTFTDHTGDLVKISLTGGEAEVTLGSAGEPDIKSIEFHDNTAGGKLTIKVNRGGATRLGEISGQADLNMLNGKSVILTDTGIDIDGDITKLILAEVQNADINFSASRPVTFQAGSITGSSKINIDGDIKTFQAVEFIGGVLNSDSIRKLFIAGQLNAEINTTENGIDILFIRQGDLQGCITSQNTIGKVVIKNGNLPGTLMAHDSIDSVLLGKGTITGIIDSQAQIGKIKADNIIQAEISALNCIDQIKVSGNFFGSQVRIGDDTSQHYQTTPQTDDGPLAFLGNFQVKGTFSNSTVAVGVIPDNSSHLLSGTIAAARGNIDSVVLGNIDLDQQSDPFGFVVLDKINTLRINGKKLSDNYCQDPFYITVLK